MTLKYLIKRDGGIGDLIMMQPALSKLKHPIIQTKHPDVFVGSPWETIPYDSEVNLNNYKFIDLDCAVEPKLILKKGSCPLQTYLNKPRVDIWYELLKVKPDTNPQFNWWVTDEETTFAKTLLKGFNRPIIIYILNTTSPYRTYPLKLASAVCKELNKNYDVILAGDHGKWANWSELKNNYFEGVLDLSDILNIRKLAAVISQADLVISPDTGPLHIAAALKIPCIALFGNINPTLRINYYSTVSPIFKKLDCYCGDTANDCPDKPFINSYIKAVGASCMWNISPQEIASKASLMLSNDDPQSFIKYYAAQYMRGEGTSAGEPLFNNQPELGTIQTPTLDWIYSGHRFSTSGDDSLIIKIDRWKDKLKPGGYLIIHETITDIYKKTNKTNNKFQSSITVLSKLNKFKIIKIEPVVHRNSFIIIAQKEQNG